jgi:hypothetical protein
MMPDPPQRGKGWNDIVPLAILAVPMLLGALGAGPRAMAEVVLVVVTIGVGWSFKHLLPRAFEDLAIVPPAAVLLVELSTVPLSVGVLFLAAVAGVGLLLWAGAEPGSGVSLAGQLEPAVIPGLAVGVALAVMLFLPSGTGGQVGIAALVLAGVLGLVAWLYLRSAMETAGPQSTS